MISTAALSRCSLYGEMPSNACSHCGECDDPESTRGWPTDDDGDRVCPSCARPALHDLYADLCEHHAADVARNAIVPDASFDEAEPTEPNAMPWQLMSREELDAVNERLMGNWLARAGR